MVVFKAELPVGGIQARVCPGVVTVVADRARHAAAIHRLVAACANDPEATSPCPTGAGIMAELHSRPGRTAVGWLAWCDQAEEAPAGLVILVAAGAASQPRWSIAALLVNPAWRRRGVGTSLVGKAMEFAGGRGASVVHAETLARWPAAVAFWRAVRLAATNAAATIEGSGESRKTAEG